MPAIHLFVIDPAEILRMVIAIMRKDIETHPSVHLLQIFPIIQRMNLRQFHQRMIVHCGGAPIHFQNRRRSQHVLPLDIPIRLLFGQTSSTAK